MAFLMKNVGFSILAALIFVTAACKNTDEKMSNDMAAEYDSQIIKLKGLTERNRAIAEYGVGLSNVPVALYNDPSTKVQDLHKNLLMIVNKHQATVDAHSELLMRLSNMQEDYNNGKITTEEARQELETMRTNLEGVTNTYERVDAYFTEQSTQYNQIVDAWKAGNPQEAAAMNEAAKNPVKSGSISPTAAGATSPTNFKVVEPEQEPKKKN